MPFWRMRDLSHTCIENLVEFFSQLRARGLTVGASEATDAVSLLEPRLLTDRRTARLALRALLAKSQREQEIFDECFEAFFVPAAVSNERTQLQRRDAEQAEARREELLRELTFQGTPIELPRELQESYVNMDSGRREKLKSYLGLSTENQRRSPFSYKFMQRILEQHLRMEDAEYETEDAAVGSDAGDLLYKDISRIGEEEMPRAVSLIQSMVRQLNGSISRNWRRSGRRGRLDFRATIRASLGSGGFYKLKYRRRPRSRRKLVLLCDVSGSMLKYSEFAIRFIKSMADVSASSRVFIFSEELREVSPFVLADMDSFTAFVKNSGLWGRGTDIGGAVHQLLEQRPAPLGGNTVLMVISDTKSVNLPEARRAMKSAAQQAGRTIWLNPIPSRKWMKMSSAQMFIDLCDMLDCSTIDELTRACARSLLH